jgi:aminoglycoside phosphotransferase (APT) family kinase protein
LFDFPKGSLDAIVIYGLPTQALPPRVLDMCGEWLQAQGVLYIAVPNKVGILHLVRNVGGALHLATMLRELRLRFPSVKSFRYDGDIVQANELVPLDSPSRSLRERVLSLLAPFVAPGLAFLASKTEIPRSLYDEVVRGIERELAGKYGQDLSLVVERRFFSRLMGFTLAVRAAPEMKEWIVRIPFDDWCLNRHQRNYAALEKLAGLPNTPAGCIPQAILSGAVLNQGFFVEAMIEGVPVSRRLLVRPNRYAEVISGAISWITQLHVASARPQVFDDSLVHELIVAPLTRAFSLLSTQSWGDESGLIKEFLVRSFRGRKIKLVFSHGDYSVDNVLFDGRTGNVRGVFDWDLAEERGLPLLDAFYFLFTAERMRKRSTPGAIFGEKLFPLRLMPAEHAVLEKYGRALEVPTDLFFPLALMTWLHHIAYRLNYPEFYHFPHWSADLTDRSLEVAISLISASQ